MRRSTKRFVFFCIYLFKQHRRTKKKTSKNLKENLGQ